MKRFVCSECKSDHIVIDAWAKWNAGLQLWELNEVFQQGYCSECMGETKIKEVTE